MKNAFSLRRIILVVLLAVLIGWLMHGLFQPKIPTIDTSEGFALLKAGAVEQAKIVDGDQRVQLVLTKDLPKDSPAEWKDLSPVVQFFYVEPQGSNVVDAVTAADPAKGYNSTVPQASVWSSLLLTLLPILLLVGLFWFLMS